MVTAAKIVKAVLTLNDTDMGERLRSIRERRGLSQATVARSLSLSSVAYGHYERGRSSLTAEQLKTLSRVLSVPVSYFFGETSTEDLLDLEIVSKFRSASPSMQAIARRVLRALLNEEAG